MRIYRIKNWNALYENNKSRERAKCGFCCVPNKQDGLGYGLLMRMENGPGMYAAFIAGLLVASKQDSPREGWLTENGRPDGCPLTADHLAVMTQIPAELFEEMLKATSDPTVGIKWIECIECPSGARAVPAECPSGALEEKRKKEEKGSAAVAPPQSDAEWLETLQADETYKALDVKGEYAKMVHWCQVNRKAPSRRRFINWLNRAERPMTAVAATSAQPTAPVWVQIKNIEEKLSKHPANPESIYHKRDCTNGEKVEFIALKAKLAQLKEQQ